MEESKKENMQNTQEEIKLLTFQPQQMLNMIEELKESISNLKSEIGYNQMIMLDLRLELERRMTWKELWYEFMLKIFGGQWE